MHKINRRKFLIITITTFIAVTCIQNVASESDGIDAWIAQQKSKIERILNKNRDRQEKSESVLAKAKRAFALAKELNDVEAMPIARKAVAKATKALNTARAKIKRNESRFHAYKLIGQHRGGKGKDIQMGIATVVEGDVKIKVQNKWVPIGDKLVIETGSEIKTGRDGFAELQLSDGTSARLDTDSMIKVVKLTNNLSTYKFLRGKALLVFHKLHQRRLRQVAVNGGVVAIRGTQVLLESGPNDTIILAFLEGSAEYKSDKNGKKVVIEAGEQLIIDAKGNFDKAIEIEPGSIERWWRAR